MRLRPYHIQRAMTLFYIGVFFAYLFGPLVVMSLTAFNSSVFPRISPWECFTSIWFQQLLNDERLVLGIQRSFFIGAIVTVTSILLGLAGALLLMQMPGRARPIYYTVLISPILIPGVVLGISTLIFWGRIRGWAGLGAESLLYDGIFLTIIGQTTFIASYCMLIFIARLQRFDRSLEEAALDLGATHVQTFFKILIPFLKPAFGSAAVIAFLASFENYNTTVFTILSKSTLTTELASKVRYGINPSISALAVIIISVTLCGAICYEILKRREQRRDLLRESQAKMAQRMELAKMGGGAGAARVAGGELGDKQAFSKRGFDAAIASVILVLIIFAGIATFLVGNHYPNQVCQDAVIEKKFERQRQINEERARVLEEEQRQEDAIKAGKQKDSPFSDVFAPDTLDGDKKEEPQEPGKQEDSPFGDVFQPQGLTQ